MELRRIHKKKLLTAASTAFEVIEKGKLKLGYGGDVNQGVFSA